MVLPLTYCPLLAWLLPRGMATWEYILDVFRKVLKFQPSYLVSRLALSQIVHNSFDRSVAWTPHKECKGELLKAPNPLVSFRWWFGSGVSCWVPGSHGRYPLSKGPAEPPAICSWPWPVHGSSVCKRSKIIFLCLWNLVIYSTGSKVYLPQLDTWCSKSQSLSCTTQFLLDVRYVEVGSAHLSHLLATWPWTSYCRP